MIIANLRKLDYIIITVKYLNFSHALDRGSRIPSSQALATNIMSNILAIRNIEN